MGIRYKHIFGPVPSRRLGMSLGVDLVPYKTCSLDCVYCEVGRTTRQTLELGEYVPTREIRAELEAYLSSRPRLDVVTFSGSGEPLLHRDIGMVLEELKTAYPGYSTALLTNSTMLIYPSVAEKLRRLDLILPSLDAASQEVFQAINRPVAGIRIEEVIEGLRSFRAGYGARMWLEVFVLPGYNDSSKELSRLKQALEYISPERVQLNTLDRPGVLPGVEPASPETMQQIAAFMDPVPCEVVAGYEAGGVEVSSSGDIAHSILQTLKRRPCTSRDLAEALGVHLNEMNKYIQALYNKERISPVHGSRGIFWRVEESGAGQKR